MLSKERIERHIQRSLDICEKRPIAWTDTDAVIDEAYLGAKHFMLHEQVHAAVDAALLDSTAPWIDEDDLLAGRLDVEWRPENAAHREEMRQKCAARGTINGTVPSSTTHSAIDYEKLLAKGLLGVLDEVKERLSQVSFSDPDCAQKRAFYKACISDLEAAMRFQQRYHAEAERLWAAEANPERKNELRRMADALANVPSKPASTFFEALQSVWLMQIMLFQLREMSHQGRPDHYLYPFYQKDLAEGRITPDDAMSLIEDWYLRLDYFYSTKRTGATALMLGGRNRAGEPVWNELSYLFIRAIETTGTVHPAVAIAYNDAIPEDLLDLCLDIIGKGYTKPAIFNDDVIIRGLREAGVREEDANYYVHSTCVEITPIGASNILVAAPYINLNKAFEYLLNDGEKMYGGDMTLYEPVHVDLATLDTFEKFYATAKQIADNIIKGMLIWWQEYVLFRKRCACLPLASCFINDCLAVGKDSADTGARYSFIYPCFPGFSNFVDALAAIRKVVYEEKKVTLPELAEILKSDFENDRRLHAYLINKCPKFGNDLDEADEIAQDMFAFLRDELKLFNTCVPNGTFHPSYFAYLHHGRLGSEAAATPDGRRQGEAISECLGAVQGMDKNGPLALIHSISKLPQQAGIGGIATNFRFSKKMMRESRQEVKALIRGFMETGNFEMQFNVIDQATLEDALKHPEQYRTLMVRVAGFSDYFVMLPPEIQREVMKRLEHDGL